MKSNALTFKQMAQMFGVLPHQLLYLDLDEFNFNLAVMYFATKEEEKIYKESGLKIEREEKEKNRFSPKKSGKQLTQKEFEQIFKVT